jgi:hypothetical protein
MHVKLRIGQRAGQIVDLPTHAATNLLTTGQAEAATEAEIAALVETDRLKLLALEEAPEPDKPGP